MERTDSPSMPSTMGRVALVLVNLIPLWGVAFAGWDLRSILVLYWAETAVIGMFAVLRVLIVTRGAEKWFLAPFMCVHMGIFMLVHYVLMHSLVLGSSGAFHSRGFEFPTPEGIAEALGTGGKLALLGFAASHGVSHVRNFLRAKEDRGLTPQRAVFAPYKRIIVMHVSILVAGFGVAFLGTPALLLATLVLGKTALDLWAHTNEHKRLRAARDHGA